MPKSVNKVILIGHLGKDPEVKYTASGIPLAKFSMATNERYKDKSGEWKDRTEWHQLVAWQRTAEIVGGYVRKGGRIYVEGRLQTSSWEDKQSGETRYRTEIVVVDLTLLGGRNEHASPSGNGASSSGRNGHSSNSRRSKPARRRERQPGEDEQDFAPVEAGITDEDIPF